MKIFKLFKKRKNQIHYEHIVNAKPRTGLQRVFKISILIGLILFSANLKAQDTIYCHKAKIAKYVVINRKTGIKKPYGRHWVDIDSGYVIKLKNGKWLINGKEWNPNSNRVSLIAIK